MSKLEDIVVGVVDESGAPEDIPEAIEAIKALFEAVVGADLNEHGDDERDAIFQDGQNYEKAELRERIKEL